MNQNAGHADRPKKHTFDINRIDYEWIEKTTKLKELKMGYDALEEDGYFPDLLRALGERIVKLDPSFARRIGMNQTHISAEEKAELNSDLNDFFADAAKTDAQLRSAIPKDQEENASIFSNGITVQRDVTSPVAEKFEKKQAAENERLKGNECVKAKEYSEAVACYTRSLTLNVDEPFTYANRAMAYIKMKDYRKAIDDANKALELKPGYLKAYHRRGKAYAARNEHELAIKDFQTILESEPENKEVNKDLMAARTLLNDQILKEVEKEKKKKKQSQSSTKSSSSSPSAPSPKVEEKKNKFVRVAIEEDSDDEEEEETPTKEEPKKKPAQQKSGDDEPVIEEVSSSETNTGTKWWSNKDTKVTKTIQSKFPLKTAKECLDHAREAKMLMQKGGDAFMKKFNQRELEKVQKEEKGKSQQEKLKELEDTQKELEKELAQAKVKQQEEKMANQAKEKAAAALKESQKQKALEEERKKKKEEEEKKRKEKEAEEAKKKEAEEEERRKAEEAEKAQKKKELEEAEKAKQQKEKEEAEKAKQQKLKEEAEKAKKLAEAEKKQSPQDTPKSETTELSAADQAKYNKQKPKVDKVLQKVEDKKQAAAEQFKLGQYGDAIKSYKAAIQVLESAVEDFKLFKKELSQMEATVFNNMAACCRKELNSKAEIDYSTKVIDRQQYITDKSVLLKAFLRRGLAYEQLEKYLQAKEDMLSVKELQYDNKQASQCLNRVQKAIKDVYGDKVPEVKKNQPIKMASSPTKVTSPVTSPQKVQETPKEEPKPKETPKNEEKEDQETVTKSELSTKFTEIKEAGNEEYKRKMWVMAIAKFGEGITMYEKNKSLCESDKELKTKVAQLYTNRALSWHQLDNQDDVIKDCTYVLKNLDQDNAKSLFRRAHSYKAKGRYYESSQDLEKVMKLDPNNKQAKKELITVKQKLREQDSEPKSKIQEVSSTTEPVKEEPKKEEEVTKGKFSTASSAPTPSKPSKTKMLNKETVDKASSMATDKATQQALKNIPKTAAGLEKDFNQLKRDSSLVYQYVKQIPLKSIIQLYKTSEVSTEVLAGLLSALSTHGLSDVDSCKHTCQFFTNLAKAENFDMTLMFMEDREQKMIAQIMADSSNKLKGGDSKIAKDMQKAFNI